VVSRQARAALGITQAEISKLIGVSVDTTRARESGGTTTRSSEIVYRLIVAAIDEGIGPAVLRTRLARVWRPSEGGAILVIAAALEEFGCFSALESIIESSEK
jgi:transcriptional regulator with XRE-family HTH domain